MVPIVFRWLFNLAATASLALCLASSVLCVSSHWVYVDLTEFVGTMYFEQLSGAGCLHFEIAGHAPMDLSFGHATEHQSEADDRGFRGAYRDFHILGDQLMIDEEIDHGGFGYVSGWYDFLKSGEQMSGAPLSPMRGVHVPYWFLALLFAILPARVINRRYRQHRRLRANRCAVCGYDLRASRLRCPECGTACSEATQGLAVRR